MCRRFAAFCTWSRFVMCGRSRYVRIWFIWILLGFRTILWVSICWALRFWTASCSRNDLIWAFLQIKGLLCRRNCCHIIMFWRYEKKGDGDRFGLEFENKALDWFRRFLLDFIWFEGWWRLWSHAVEVFGPTEGNLSWNSWGFACAFVCVGVATRERIEEESKKVWNVDWTVVDVVRGNVENIEDG